MGGSDHLHDKWFETIDIDLDQFEEEGIGSDVEWSGHLVKHEVPEKGVHPSFSGAELFGAL